MVFWGNSLSLRRWNRPESDPHLAAIVNATFKHSLLLSLSPFVPKPFSGTAKGLISSATNNPSHGGIDSFQSPYYAIVSAFPTYHYQFIIPSFSVSPSSFSISTWFLSSELRNLFPLFCFCFFMAAVLFELLDFFFVLLWPFCFTCGSVFLFIYFISFLYIIAILDVAFNCSILTKEVEDWRSFFKKNRFLKRFLFCLQKIGLFVFFLNY